MIIMFSVYGVHAQTNDTIVYYSNKTIAYKKQNDSVFFYNSLGSLRKVIDLKNKKIIPHGLPKEVQDIVFGGKIPERVEVSEETFPTYLYTQKYIDAGVVLCSKHIFYNNLGLKIGYEEVCPDDTGGSDYHFGDKNIYEYNKYGLLTRNENTIYEYNENGQLIKVGYRKNDTSKVHYYKEYRYYNHRLSELSIHSSNGKNKVIKYSYNSNGLLSEIITGKYSKIVLGYNRNEKIIKVTKLKIFTGNIYEHNYLTYVYDMNNRIIKVLINHELY